MAILTIARLTLREASRRRLLLAVAILTVIVAFLSGWAFHRLLELPCGTTGQDRSCSPVELKALAATLLILLMFMFSFVLALGAAFLGAPSIANDVESGIMLSILPRPIRRSDVVIGKWLGLSALLALYAAMSCGMEFVIGRVAFDYVPPHPILSILFIVGEAVVVLTLSLAGSTRVSAMAWGIVVLVLFGLTWIAGVAGAVGAQFHSRAIENIGSISSLLFPTDGLWRAAIYNLEPAALLAVGDAGRVANGNPFFVLAPPATPYLAWSVGWVLVILALTLWSFNRREL